MMKCRDFLLEFEDRNGELSEAATLHVKICADCQKTSDDQTRVWLMIDDLKRVDAPNDFDFRVKARIANHKPTDFQPKFLPVLRYVLPAAFIVLILGAVAFNSTYFSGGSSPQTAATSSPTLVETPISPTNVFASNQIVAAKPNYETPISPTTGENIKPVINNRENQIVAVKYPVRTRAAAPKKNSAEEGVGSRVFSSTQPKPSGLPLGFEQKPPVGNLPNANNRQSSIDDVQILEFIGIESVSETDGRKVKAIKSNSAAERSGVKIGDVVEAIDGRKISEEPTRGNTVEGKSLTVKRGAERIEINLQSKSN